MYLAHSDSGKTFPLEVTDEGVFLNGNRIGDHIQSISKNQFQVIHNHKVFRIEILSQDTKEITLKVNQNKYTINLKDNLDQVMEKMGISQTNNAVDKDIKAPMPGMILEVLANEGQTVNKGDALLVLEAMKMENILKAPGDVTISKIQVKQGDSVEKKQVLIEFD